MRIIELPDYTAGREEYYGACASILGYMFFPNNDYLRLRYTINFLKTIAKPIYLNRIENETNIETLKNIASSAILMQDSDFSDIGKQVDTQFSSGIMAGDILWYTIQIFNDNRVNEPSIAKAKEIIRTKFALVKTISDTKAPRSEIGGAWSEFKDVAHFWSAWREMQGDSKHEILSLSCPVVQDFRRFIAIAENTRAIGQNLRAKRQPTKRQGDGFVLNKDTVYRLPENYKIPEILSVDIPPLDKWSIEILKAKFKRC